MYGNGKRLLSLLVACVLMITMLPAIALAEFVYELSITGITGGTYTGGTLTFDAAEHGYSAQTATVSIKANGTGGVKDIVA